MAHSEGTMRRPRIATVWLAGCSGCHMSLLNLHGRLLELFDQCDLVYSPLIDIKEYPQNVDIALIEGAVTNDDNREMARIIRERTACVASFGDCAVNGNVTALRNPIGRDAALREAYGGCKQAEGLTRLLPVVLPLHQEIRVDAFIPGCPPDPERIWLAFRQLIEGKPVQLPPDMIRFG